MLSSASSAWARALVSIGKAEDVTRVIVRHALEDVAVEVSRRFGMAYDEVMICVRNVVDRFEKPAQERTICRGQTADGTACKLSAVCGTEYCSTHRAQGEVILQKKRKLEAYKAALEKLRDVPSSTMTYYTRDSDAVPDVVCVTRRIELF